MAYWGSVPIGIGRVIGDGGCFFEVVDIAVLPAHQKKGVGDLIMRALMGYIHENAPPTAYVSLMADHGTPKFYERYGFQPSVLPKKAGMFLRIQWRMTLGAMQCMDTCCASAVALKSLQRRTG